MNSIEKKTLRFVLSDATLVAERSGVDPDFLLLHAGGERRSVWFPVMDRLGANGFTSLAPDQRGHGESSGMRGDGIRAYAADVGAILATLDKPVILVGASLGGFAAMLALADPACRSRVAGLALVDVVPDPDPDRARDFLRATTPPLDSSPLVDDILSQAAGFSAACAGIHVPVLLLLAEHGVVSQEEVMRLAAAIEVFEVQKICRSGHLIARDQPIRLADQLIRFASRIDRRPADHTA